MRFYETCLILRPKLAPEEADQVAEKIQNMVRETGGVIAKVDSWGKRRLAYTIDKEKEGFYYFLRFSQDPGKISEMKRQLKLMPEVLRFMIFKMEQGGNGA